MSLFLLNTLFDCPIFHIPLLSGIDAPPKALNSVTSFDDDAESDAKPNESFSSSDLEPDS